NSGNNTDNTGNGGTAGATTLDVGITKTAPANPVEGVPFDYTLVVTNHGPITATGVTITDTLPATFAVSSAAATQGSCSGTTTITCNLGTILNGGNVTITIHGTPSTPGPLSNTATVTSNETDSAPGNNSATVAIVVVEDVPALSAYALMLLAVALAIAAATAMKRA
ncbi:MAG: trimeric autotransporter adhesin, partial [Thermoanaerobaculia bacterium]|nr:trimeric autotransporter adhesin [Thermoanaerobaculia bacterium]